MRESNKFIGLDVHKSTIAISIAPEDGGEVRYFGEIPNTHEALTKPTFSIWLDSEWKPFKKEYDLIGFLGFLWF